MTTATPTAPALDAYQLVDADEVRAFLAKHPFMEPLLGEVAAELPKYFPGAPLRLSVDYDPEGYGPPELVLFAVVVDWELDAAQAALDEFADKWWLDRYDRGQNLLVITFAFG